MRKEMIFFMYRDEHIAYDIYAHLVRIAFPLPPPLVIYNFFSELETNPFRIMIMSENT